MKTAGTPVETEEKKFSFRRHQYSRIRLGFDFVYRKMTSKLIRCCRIQLFRETLSEKSKKLHKPIPKGILGYGQ